MLVHPEEFLHISNFVMSEGKGKTLKQSQPWQHSPHLALPRPQPLPACSPPLTHILFHPLLVSTFSSTFWVNCGTLNWLVWSHHLEISVNKFDSLCVNSDSCVAVGFNLRLPVFSILKQQVHHSAKCVLVSENVFKKKSAWDLQRDLHEINHLNLIQVLQKEWFIRHYFLDYWEFGSENGV